MTPPHLISNWVNEWDKSIDHTEGRTDMKLLIAHSQTAKAYPDRALSRRKDHNKLLAFDSETKSAKHGQERYVVITSSKSYESRVRQELGLIRTWTINPGKRNAKTCSEILDNVAWSRAIQDEFHQAKNPEVIGIRIFRGLKGNPFFWFLSGTPFEIGPGDIVGYTGLLEKAEWETDDVLKLGMHDNLSQMGKSVAQIVRSGVSEGLEAITDKFGGVLLPKLMIRRKGDDLWFGKPTVDLGPNRHKDIEVPFSETFKRVLENLEKKAMDELKADFERRLANWKRSHKPSEPEPKLNTKRFFKTSRDHHLFATFPGLMKLKELYPDLAMTSEELKQSGWLDEPKKSPYFKYLDLLMETSLKYREIRRILTAIEKGRDDAGRREKMVIMSQYPVIVFILWLVSHRNNHKLLLCGRTSSQLLS